MRTLASVLMLVLVAGCAPKPLPQPLLRVTVLYPGAVAQDVEAFLAVPIESMLAASPDIDSITSICSAGKLEVYLDVKRGTAPQQVIERLTSSLQHDRILPDMTREPVVELLPQSATIPVIQPTLVDEIVFDMNREATNQYVFTTSEIATILQATDLGNVSAEERLERLREIRVPLSDDSDVLLTELGELRIEKTPDTIIRTWP